MQLGIIDIGILIGNPNWKGLIFARSVRYASSCITELAPEIFSCWRSPHIVATMWFPCHEAEPGQGLSNTRVVVVRYEIALIWQSATNESCTNPTQQYHSYQRYCTRWASFLWQLGLRFLRELYSRPHPYSQLASVKSRNYCWENVLDQAENSRCVYHCHLAEQSLINDCVGNEFLINLIASSGHVNFSPLLFGWLMTLSSSLSTVWMVFLPRYHYQQGWLCLAWAPGRQRFHLQTWSATPHACSPIPVFKNPSTSVRCL